MLDRALVVGTFEEPTKGFYSSWNKNVYKDLEFQNQAQIQICDDGQEQDGDYSEIWSYIQEDSDDEKEKQFFDELILKSKGVYEKPIYGGSVKYNNEIINVDLIWKNSKVLFFLIDNSEDYKKIKNCGWKVFCLEDGSIDVDLFLKSIEE